MRTKYNPKTAKLFYLNQDGSRCVNIDRNGNRETIPVSLDGVNIRQTAIKYWQQCGNFAFPNVRNKNKIIAVYPDSEVAPTKWMPYEIRYPKKS